MKNHPKRKLIATLILSSGLSVGFVAETMAQTAAAPPPEKEKKGDGGAVEKLETITVTGSNVPTAPGEVAVPVSILGPEQIDQTGINANALEILRKSLPGFAGRSNTGNSNANNNNQNTAGGSQVQLRNLDTLVLINGRRVATSGINAIGGKSFVDINQIPTAAIERIEVLSDGSSAIYGSDAIGGVVNIILKSSYEGSEVGGRFGHATGNGNYSEHSEYFVTGKELAKGIEITVAGSSSHTDPLYQNSRSFTSPLTGRVSLIPGAVGANGTNPGALLAGGLNSPRDQNPTGAAATANSIAALIANGTYVATSPAGVSATYDLSQFQTLLLKQDQDSMVSTFTADLFGNNRLVAFGDLMYSRTKSFTQFLPITRTVAVPAGAPYNPLTTAFPNVTFGYLPAPKQYYNDATGDRITTGLRGDLAKDWNWESAFVYSENLLDQQQRNVLYVPNFARAVAGGFDASGNPVAGGHFSRVAGGFLESNSFVIQPALDPFARTGGVDSASLANLLGTETIHAASRLTAFDVKVVGKAFELPAGRLGVAVGASARRETLAGETDSNGRNTAVGTSTCVPANNNCQLWAGGTFSDPFASSRRIDAAFAEVLAPISGHNWILPGAHALDLIAAVRMERYSDVGDSTVPKFGFRWQPVDTQLTVRGTYAKSFTAPTLFAMFGPTGTRQVGGAVIQSVFGGPQLPFQGEDGNNPELKPSKAKSSSVGIVLTPKAIQGLRLAMDYSKINQEGFAGGIGFANILQSVDQLGAASPFSANIARGNFPGQPGATPFTTPGELGNYIRAGNNLDVFAIDRFTNLGGIREQSITASADYEMPTDKAGTFSLSTTGAIFLHYKFQALSSQNFYEYAGFATNGGTGVQGTLPKYRFYSTANWRYHEWDATLGNTYISAVTDIGPGGIVYANSTTLKALPVSRYVSWDLRLGYTAEIAPSAGQFVKGWKLGVGVNNVANRMPPLSPQAFTDNNADVATYSPLGRLVYATAAIKF
jgi:iron complex outermembrane recepter protein